MLRPPGRHDVRIWLVRLNPSEEIRASCEKVLSADEIERASRYHFELHRRRFICARGALRMLLGQYTGMHPEDIQFSYDAKGKPRLAHSTSERTHFNLAHSGELALIAFCKCGELGIDLEEVRVLPDFDELVSRFFSKGEAACFQALEAVIKPVAFFNLWTRKEALLKATGDGICNALDQVEVTFLPDEPARLVALPENQTTAPWILRGLQTAPGYAAALAIKAERIAIICQEFVPENLSISCS